MDPDVKATLCNILTLNYQSRLVTGLFLLYVTRVRGEFLHNVALKEMRRIFGLGGGMRSAKCSSNICLVKILIWIRNYRCKMGQ